MKKFDGINMIPFIDIMLVLFAIILTTSTLVEKNIIPVSLPNATSKTKLNSKNIIITLKKDNSIFWEEKNINKKQLLQKIKEVKKEDTILINCDKNSKFGYFVTLLDILKSQGLEKISIITTKINE